MARKYKIDNSTSFYFVTFTVVDWIDVFTNEDCRDIFVDSVNYCHREKGLLIGGWSMMTNHVHMIISATEGNNLSNIIRDLKSFTSKQIRKHLEESQSESRRSWILPLLKRAGLQNSRNKDFQFWQQHNHPIELTDNEMMASRLNYIHENPVKAGFVDYDYRWKYSSARDYNADQGLIEIYFLD